MTRGSSDRAIDLQQVSIRRSVRLGTFLRHVADDRLYGLWMLYCTTGMRRGEALGLRWDDVDLDAGTVFVHRNRTLVKGKVIEREEPKTSASRRRISIDAETAKALRRCRRQQLEDRVACGGAWHDSGHVFVVQDGQPLHPKAVSRWFVEHAKAAGLPRIRPHDVRHSYATAALSNGEPITVVSRRLGHAAVSITLDVYSHVLPTDDQDTATRTAALILGGR